MEYHPRINALNPVLFERKIILGSFPTWALTEPDLKAGETTEEKNNIRIKNGDLHFFYGSSTNLFWFWYKKFVDNKILKDDIRSIKASLSKNKIGITDLIISCNRKKRSALDKHLTNRSYNHSFLKYPAKGETVKILCTSKGVMNEMLFNNNFFRLHKELHINEEKSIIIQEEFMLKINGNPELIRKPFFRMVETNSGGAIECFSIPSPGSPFRRLTDFGMDGGHADQYLDGYLEEVFKWFKS